MKRILIILTVILIVVGCKAQSSSIYNTSDDKYDQYNTRLTNGNAILAQISQQQLVRNNALGWMMLYASATGMSSDSISALVTKFNSLYGTSYTAPNFTYSTYGDLDSLVLNGYKIKGVSNDSTLADNDSAYIVTEKAVKGYVDANTTTYGDLDSLVLNGYKIKGVSNDSTLADEDSTYIITEYAAKKYADNVIGGNPVLTNVTTGDTTRWGIGTIYGSGTTNRMAFWTSSEEIASYSNIFALNGGELTINGSTDDGLVSQGVTNNGVVITSAGNHGILINGVGNSYIRCDGVFEVAQDSTRIDSPLHTKSNVYFYDILYVLNQTMPANASTFKIDSTTGQVTYVSLVPNAQHGITGNYRTAKREVNSIKNNELLWHPTKELETNKIDSLDLNLILSSYQEIIEMGVRRDYKYEKNIRNLWIAIIILLITVLVLIYRK